MKKIKKMPLVIVSLIVLVLITGTTIFFLNTRETEKNEKLDPKTEEKEAKEEKEDDLEKEEKVEEEPVVEEEVTQNTEEPTQNNNTSSSSNNNTSSSSSSSSKSNNNYVAPSSPPVQNQQPQQTTPEPSCTPKKFYTAFRPDFSVESECEKKFNYYNTIDDEKYYGYICTDEVDDCGVTYYMLTFYDIYGNYFGYDEV